MGDCVVVLFGDGWPGTGMPDGMRSARLGRGVGLVTTPGNGVGVPIGADILMGCMVPRVLAVGDGVAVEFGGGVAGGAGVFVLVAESAAL